MCVFDTAQYTVTMCWNSTALHSHFGLYAGLLVNGVECGCGSQVHMELGRKAVVQLTMTNTSGEWHVTPMHVTAM